MRGKLIRVDWLRREPGTIIAGTLGVLVPLLVGCPQLLDDHFIDSPDAGSDGPQSQGEAGGGGTDKPGPGPGPDESTAMPPGGPEKPKPPSPPGCVSTVESCDGLDNDCDGVVDEAPACAGGCAGLVLEGRGAMFCGGSGATFADAEARCSAKQMRPVVIGSAPKSTAVLRAVASLYPQLSTIAESQSSIWLDAHDGETEGTWHWGASGTVFWLGDATGAAQNGAYTDWATGKPNNAGAGDGEDCAVMHVGTGADPLGTWNDETCEGLHAFLCESPAP
jgi:lectin-like protein